MALRAMESQPLRSLPSAGSLEGARGRAYELLYEIWDNIRLLVNALDSRHPKARPTIPEDVLQSWPGGKLRLEEGGVAIELYKTPGTHRDAYTIRVTGVPLPPPIAGVVPWSSEEARHLVVDSDERAGFQLSEAVALGHLMAHPKIGGKVSRLVERLESELARRLNSENMEAWREFFAVARMVATSLERAVERGVIPAELLEQWFFQIPQPLIVNVDDATTAFIFATDIPAIAVRRRLPDGRYGHWLIADFGRLAGHRDERLAEAAKLGVKIIEGDEVLETVARHAPTLAEHLRDYATGLTTEEVLPILEWLADFARRIRDALDPVITVAAPLRG